MGRIIKQFNFINEPYIIYPTKDKSNLKDKKGNTSKSANTPNTPKQKQPVPDKDKLKSIYDDAFKKGREEGFSEGRELGLREGQIEGEKKGREEGFKIGYRDGFEKGKKEGFEKGYEEGFKKGKGEFAQIISSFTNTISEFISYKEKFIEEIKSKILDFSFKFAEVILKRELKRDDKVVINILKEALDYIVMEDSLLIKVNISDIELVEEFLSQNLSLIEKNVNVSVIGDETLERGSVILIGPSGEVDARISSMMERVKESLIG